VRHIIEKRQVGRKTKARETHKRAAHLTPLYGCSPGHCFELVTRFYCSVANYHRLVKQLTACAVYCNLEMRGVAMPCYPCRRNDVLRVSA